MRRMGLMLVLVLGCATLMHAQNSSHKMQMSGTICRSSCVTSVANLATCDKSCTDTSGDAVLVDDQGEVKKIANQDMCMPHMGKHVKMMVEPQAPTERQREDTLRVLELSEQAGGY